MMHTPVATLVSALRGGGLGGVPSSASLLPSAEAGEALKTLREREAKVILHPEKMDAGRPHWFTINTGRRPPAA